MAARELWGFAGAQFGPQKAMLERDLLSQRDRGDSAPEWFMTGCSFACVCSGFLSMQKGINLGPLSEKARITDLVITEVCPPPLGVRREGIFITFRLSLWATQLSAGFFFLCKEFILMEWTRCSFSLFRLT